MFVDDILPGIFSGTFLGIFLPYTRFSIEYVVTKMCYITELERAVLAYEFIIVKTGIFWIYTRFLLRKFKEHIR